MAAPVPVILTREKEDNAALAALIQGPETVCIDYPCIALKIMPYDGAPIGGLALEDFPLVVFTSRRGVMGMAGVAERLRAYHPQVAAVGPATRDALKDELGLEAFLAPGEAVSAALARELLAAWTHLAPFLLVRGAKSSGILARELGAAGVDFRELTVYRHETVTPPPLSLNGPVVAVLASPSAVETFCLVNPGLPASSLAVTIGPLTSRAAHAAGFRLLQEAPGQTRAALAHAVAAALHTLTLDHGALS